jgi:hypothetical protein
MSERNDNIKWAIVGALVGILLYMFVASREGYDNVGGTLYLLKGFRVGTPPRYYKDDNRSEYYYSPARSSK